MARLLSLRGAPQAPPDSETVAAAAAAAVPAATGAAAAATAAAAGASFLEGYLGSGVEYSRDRRQRQQKWFRGCADCTVPLHRRRGFRV